jgi:hypothetical protein
MTQIKNAKRCSLILLLFVSFHGFSQHNLDDFFKGGRQAYSDFVHKKAKQADARKGRYGLVLFSFTLHANDSIDNYRILSSPSKLISERALEVLELSDTLWNFPKSAKTDSLNILAGFYFIKANNDRWNNKEKYTQVDYADLYKEYSSSGFETSLPDVFSTPFIFIGIVTVKYYGMSSIE